MAKGKGGGRMLSVKEVAEQLGVQDGVVRAWCINGTLPNAVRTETPRGPFWQIPETDLRGFEKRGRGRPPKVKTESKIESKPS